ncbi:LOW QUALITY PROTEIN: E3 ubiquitin-protein ligase CHFR, partial [Galemys pyrenaicus]
RASGRPREEGPSVPGPARGGGRGRRDAARGAGGPRPPPAAAALTGVSGSNVKPMEPPEEREQPPPPQPWGRLLRLGAEEGEPQVLLSKREWTIGRRRGCDLSFPSNKLVSGDHCKIIVDEKSGQVSLEDTSTNGTVINKLKVVKRQTCPLQTGDVIYVVYRKNEPEHNVAYLYESLSEEQGTTQDPSGTNEDNVLHVTKGTSEAGQGDQALPPSPATQACFEEPQPSTSTSDLFLMASTSSTELALIGPEPPSSAGPGGADISPGGCGPVAGARPSTPVAPPAQLCRSSTPPAAQDQEGLEPVKKRTRGDGEANMALPLLAADQCPAAPASLEAVKAAALKPDRMEETLTCIICQDLLHDCVRCLPQGARAGAWGGEAARAGLLRLHCLQSGAGRGCAHRPEHVPVRSLQPCMHTFCAACYSGWMERSALCPTCRCPVERICKNHILNNLVEAYLLQHPGNRSEDDVRSMAARNKITQDMLQPKVRRSCSDEEGSSEDLLELSDVDSESSDVSQPYIVCRQCPEFRRQTGQPLPCPGPGSEPGAPLAQTGEAPSTSTNATAAQDYVCALQGSHAICTCCFQPMPDRRAEREQDPRIAPQQCEWGCVSLSLPFPSGSFLLSGRYVPMPTWLAEVTAMPDHVSMPAGTICLQPFCHLYWGCTRSGCLGCLAPFCELNLGDRCLDGVLSNNNYESDILKSYLATRGLTWRNVLTESLAALRRGAFLLSDYRVSGSTVLCYCCGLRSFRELTYQYRQSIPASELPAAVTSRPDCYWGRNCRTQVKAHHAM